MMETPTQNADEDDIFFFRTEVKTKLNPVNRVAPYKLTSQIANRNLDARDSIMVQPSHGKRLSVSALLTSV